MTSWAPRKKSPAGRKPTIPCQIGQVFGTRTVIAEQRVHGQLLVTLECACGNVKEVQYNNARHTKWCFECGMRKRKPNRKTGLNTLYSELLHEAVDRCPEVWLGEERACIEAAGELGELLGRGSAAHARSGAQRPTREQGWHPDGMTLEQIGVVLGLTRERVRQIQVIALAKLRKGLRKRGYDSLPVTTAQSMWSHTHSSE